MSSIPSPQHLSPTEVMRLDATGPLAVALDYLVDADLYLDAIGDDSWSMDTGNATVVVTTDDLIELGEMSTRYGDADAAWEDWIQCVPEYTDVLRWDVIGAATLQGLADALNAFPDTVDLADAGIDSTDLPTYGGEDASDLDVAVGGVWSWDETHILINPGDGDASGNHWQIIPREPTAEVTP